MSTAATRSALAQAALGVGALAVLATGADHLYEYTANGFSTVPTIGMLFLWNFIAATMVGVSLLLPLRWLAGDFADPLRALLALAGVGLAATSLLSLWISESSSLFGFTDHGFRATIVVAIVAESTSLLALTTYLALARGRLLRSLRTGTAIRRAARGMSGSRSAAGAPVRAASCAAVTDASDRSATHR